MEFDLDWHRLTSTIWPDVSYELRPLRVWAFLELMDFGQPPTGGPAGSAEGAPALSGLSEPAGRLSAAASLRLMDVARRILPDHVRHLQGVMLRQAGAVQPAQPADLCDEAPLLPLVGEIIARLVTLSDVSPAAEKN